MQTTSADYKTAIAATDREIRGYLKFNNSFVMRGSDGLISFKTTQNAMDGERYCLGSVTSAYCEASFFNSALDGSGVSLANSYFDAYIGVCTVELPDADVDYVTETLAVSINYTFNSGTYIAIPQTGMKAQLQALKDGDEIVFTISNVDYVGTWDATLHKASVTDGTLTYTLFYDGYAWAKLSINDANDDPVYGTYKIALTARVYKVEYVCCGRYWVSEITRTAKTTNIAGYDVAGRLSMDYVCTVTPDPDNGYLVMDVLNDIIDQTGVNNGVHFSTFGDSTYVPALVEGNCKSQWGWLCTIAGNDDVNEYTGKREPADLGYIGTYYAGNGASAYAITDDTLYMDGFNAGDEFTITSLTTGTKENPIVVGNGFGINSANPYIDNAKAASIENTVDSYQYYPVTMKWRGDPCLDVMDELSVTHDGVTYKTLCMKIVTTFNGGLQQDITAWADSEAFYALSTSPMESKIQTVSNLVSEIAQAIETADGGVITKILDTDGTWKELVIANNQDLSQATSVWRFNINGLAHSDRYQGGTYTLAMDTQGRIVANVIQTGILQDANGKNSWNLDTGELVITDGSITATYTDPKIFYRADYDADPDINTNQDFQDLRNIILRGAPFSDAELERYDFNGNGTITSADLIKLRNMILADKDLVTSRTAVIDPRLATVIKVWNTQLRDTPLHTTEQTADAYIASYESYDDSNNPIGERMSLEGTGLFGYTNGSATATYPVDASTLLRDNGLSANHMAGSGYYIYSSTGTTTIDLVNDHAYLVTLTRRNSTDGSYNAMWLVSAGTNNSSVTTIKSGTGSSASVSGLTLSITRGTTYSRVSWLRLC